MQHRHLLSPLLSPLLLLAVLAACAEQEPPMAPDETGPLPSEHTPGHKVVNSLADPGDGTCNAAQCTLREAINHPGSTEISFAPGLTGTITLARPDAGGGTLVIDKRLSITGPRATIEIRRLRTDPAFQIFRIGSGAVVTLTNLTIRNGRGNPAAGILNLGTLRLARCTVAGNAGNGIFNEDRLTVTRSTVGDNGGVGIFTLEGALALTQSTVQRNSRGGLIITQSNGTISHARILGNSANGGILASGSTVIITHSTIARNSGFLGGGIDNREGGTVTIRNSTIVGNTATLGGGGIANETGFVELPLTLTLINSTVSDNSAEFGGGIVNTGFEQASITVRNSTIAHNSATQGGGIDQTTGVAVLINSLVAENSAGSGPDVFRAGGSVRARFNLIGDGSGSGITNTDGNQVGNVPPNASPIDPRIGPLANNGGPTRTHALLLGSPAIDAASTPACPTTDQRGVLRPQGPACDIGSFERVRQ
jgi:CSLREA domain-containing protein